MFLLALKRTGNVSTACAKAKVHRSTAYEYRDTHADFAADWDEVLEVGVDAIEQALKETAELAPLGVPGAVTAAIFILKCRRPATYNPPEKREVTGKDGAPIQATGPVQFVMTPAPPLDRDPLPAALRDSGIELPRSTTLG